MNVDYAGVIHGFELMMLGLVVIALPTCIALLRNMNILPVLFFNFALGWSLFGWFFALFLATRPLPPWHPDRLGDEEFERRNAAAAARPPQRLEPRFTSPRMRG